MKKLTLRKVILLISGLVASGIGALILFSPESFYAAYGIELEGNINLLNEIRASGGSVLASGIFITLGALVDRLAFTAIVVSILLYFPYSLSRFFSIVIDGMPSSGLVQAALLEIGIAAMCIFVFASYVKKNKEV